MYNAATKAEAKSLEFQQVAISYAAHNSLAWVFHGTRLYPILDDALKTIQTQILGSKNSSGYSEAMSIGRRAAQQETASRANDGFNDFVDYTYGSPAPGVYQVTMKNYNYPPDNPQVPYVDLFAIRKSAMAYLAPAPPSVKDASYEGYLNYTKAVGRVDSTIRTQDQKDISLFWRESAPM